MDKERRSIKAELRANGRSIKGLAARFNALSDDLGGFVEMILPEAFDLENSPSVIFNYDHDDRNLLARTESGTLKLTQDAEGLWFETELPNTTLGNDLIELINRGDLRGCSFAFNVSGPDGEEWGKTEDGKRLRKLKKVLLYDVCITPCPAYPDTSIALRSLKNVKESNLTELRKLRLKLVEKTLHR